VAAGAEEIAMRGGEREALMQPSALARLRAHESQTDRSAEREVLSFFDGDDDVAIGDARPGLLGLDFDALENTEAVELALRFEHRRVAERIAGVEVRRAQHDFVFRVRVAA